uniref:Aminotransferase class V domain-containing protein n=1 Tax=Oryza brachyantha TaxID=4533 RepID=J3MUY8_ORYBR
MLVLINKYLSRSKNPAAGDDGEMPTPPANGAERERDYMCISGCVPVRVKRAPVIATTTITTTARTSRHNFVKSAASGLFPGAQFTNHESLPALEEAYSEFAAAFPQYAGLAQADAIRDGEYQHLDRHVCLDYTGINLFSHAQMNSSVPSTSASPPGYPYLWMSAAQEHGWHVALDACALGTKDLDTLGLSLLRPDFIVCNFFKVFGENPSGFAGLFVKKASLAALERSVIARSIGVVSIVPARRWSLHDAGYSTELDHSRSFADPAEDLDLTSSFSGPLSGTLIALSLRNVPEMDAAEENGHTPEIREARPIRRRRPTNTRCLRRRQLKRRRWRYDADRAAHLEHMGGGGGKRKDTGGGGEMGIYVVNASLGFLSNFEDAYRLWAFVAKFLDADFVEKERWRYTALNQKTVEV